VEEGGRYDVLN